MRTKLVSILLLALMTLGCNNSAHAQAPDAVKARFQKLYVGENSPDWHEDFHGNYEFNVKIDGFTYRANYAPSGKWIETETSVDIKDLPHVIRDLIKSRYESEEVTDVEM